MLNLKMKMCKKYSNCRHESNATGETLFTIMWRHKSNWSMNYPRTKYLTYMVKDCLYVSRSERRSFLSVHIWLFIHMYITRYDALNDIFKMINLFNIILYEYWDTPYFIIYSRLSRVILCTVLMPIKNVISIQLWPIL